VEDGGGGGGVGRKKKRKGVGVKKLIENSYGVE